MQLSKFSFKAFVLTVIGLASFAAASGIAPLTFGDESTDEENWNYLINFKMWGQEIVSFGNNNKFPNEAGWVGTATGNLESTGNDAVIAGTIVVGGSVQNTGKMTLSTGPIRYNGSIADGGRASGTKCQGTTTAGDCKDVPQYKTNLTVPKMTSWPANLGNISVGDISTYEIDARSTTDFYYSNISLGAESKLLIKMPKGGRVTRIFTKSLSLNNHPHILVQYEGEQLPRCNSKANYTCGGDYEGNLLIFVDSDITFRNSDYSPIDGTIVSTGTINIICNMAFAGQLWAREFVVGHEVNGDGFQFVPIDVFSKLTLSNKDATFKESDTWQTIDVGLTDAATTDISFSYCFDFYSAAGIAGVYAGHQDVGAADASHLFPICGERTTKVTISAGKTKAEGIVIKPLIDGLVENSSTGGEKLWLVIRDLKGANLSMDNYDEAKGGFNIYITNVDEFPTVKTALSFDVNEDEKHTFTKNEFQFQHASQNFASVIITSLPNKGALYNGTTKLTSVGSGITIAVTDLGKLTYQAAANEFGNSYTSFKYKVVGDGVEGGNTSIEYTATVNVIPVNDKPTVADAAFTVNELNQDVSGGPITVSDVSNERNVDTYIYNLVNVSGSDYATFCRTFEISKLSNQNATIKVKSGVVLDYSVQKQYVVYATVTDDAATESQTVTSGGAKSSNQFRITVKIQNENDPPTIGNQTFTIAEKKADGSDWPSGTSVGKVTTASDPDGDPLTYSVVTPDVPFKFNNGSNELVITDGSVLDFETKPTWTLKVQVSDGELSATATVTVNLEDVDEPSPSIVFDYEGDVLVNGNASTGDAIDNFTSNNSKEIQDQLSEIVSDLSYTLASNTSANVTDYFNIDIESGDITAKTELVFEALYPDYAFTIGIDATGKNVSDEPVSVNISKKIVIKDVNEAPVITNENPLVVSGSVLNNGGIVGKVEAVDPDSCSFNPLYVCANGSHPYGFNKLKYSIKEVIEVDGSTDFPFEIDPNTGIISVSKGPSLVKRYNYDYTSVVRKVTSLNSTKQKQYQFIVEVTDSSSDSDNESKSVQKLMSIDVTEDNTAPVFESIASDYEVSENTSVGETFGEAFQVYDEDVSDVNKLTASIADKDECDVEKNCAQTLFEVMQDGETNEETHISQFKFKVKKDLDYETLYKETDGKVAFNVTVSVTDGANHSVTSDVVIHVNDVNEEPTFEKASYVFTVAENTTIDDSNPVGTVAAKDSDVFNSTYGTISYNLEGDDAIFFVINASGGITMKEEYTLDYETRSSYSLNANVSDGTSTKSVPVAVNVTDVNEAPIFVEPTKTLAFSENEMGSVFETLTFDDFDTESEFRNNKFECTNCDDYGFELNEDTGELKTTRTFDYETDAHSYDLNIVIKDAENANLTATGKVTVSLKDVPEAPVFLEENPTFSVEENVENAEVGVVAAFDDDCKNDNPCSASVYSLAGTDENPDDYNSFTIDENTGAIKVNGKLDYETKNSYKFKVIVTDGDFSDGILVTVNVTDVNENPIFVEPTKTLAFAENEMGAVIETLTFDDLDTAAKFRNNKFECTNCDDFGFELNEDTGELKTTRTFDYETSDHSFELNIAIKDAENADLTATGKITVNLTNVPEAPVFSKSIETTFDIDENATSGTIVGTVAATDDDCKGDFESTCSKPTYSLSAFVGSEGDNDLFTIDSDGTIKLAKDDVLDYDTKSVYEYHVIATDGENEELSSSIDVTINVFNITNKPTIADDGKTGYDVAENTATDKEIACYVVNDPDRNQTAKLKASFTDVGNTKASNWFDAKIKNVGSSYKLCLVVKDGDKLDYETIAHTHKVKLSVIDPDLLTAEITKTINITDVNEKPSVSGSLFNSFYEHTGANHVVAQLSADDADTAKAFTNNFFSIVAGDTALFSITGNGLIKTKRDFDYEKESRYVYKVSVVLYDSDSKNYPNFKDTAVVQITLKDSPNDPVSSSSSKPASSSSSKPASSSSKNVASSSSQVIASSSSEAESSSSSRAFEYASPTFRVQMTAPFVFQIVMTDSAPYLAKQYAVMDMMGHVISVGELNEGSALVTVPTRGAYVVRVGLGYQRVNVK